MGEAITKGDGSAPIGHTQSSSGFEDILAKHLHLSDREMLLYTYRVLRLRCSLGSKLIGVRKMEERLWTSAFVNVDDFGRR